MRTTDLFQFQHGTINGFEAGESYQVVKDISIPTWYD